MEPEPSTPLLLTHTQPEHRPHIATLTYALEAPGSVGDTASLSSARDAQADEMGAALAPQLISRKLLRTFLEYSLKDVQTGFIVTSTQHQRRQGSAMSPFKGFY